MSAKDKSAIVSGMGVGMSIIQSLVGKARQHGVSDEVIHSLATPEGDILLDKFVEILAGIRRATNDSDSYPVTVDYHLSLREMIAAGRYGWVDDDITAKHFPVKGEGAVDVEIRLVHFDRAMDPDDVLREFERMNLCPATLPESAALGAKYPDLQRQFSIVILGSVWRDAPGGRCVPHLWYGKDGRHLCLGWFRNRWHEGCRFAAVRK